MLVLIEWQGKITYEWAGSKYVVILLPISEFISMIYGRGREREALIVSACGWERRKDFQNEKHFTLHVCVLCENAESYFPFVTLLSLIFIWHFTSKWIHHFTNRFYHLHNDIITYILCSTVYTKYTCRVLHIECLLQSHEFHSILILQVHYNLLKVYATPLYAQRYSYPERGKIPAVVAIAGAFEIEKVDKIIERNR